MCPREHGLLDRSGSAETRFNESNHGYWAGPCRRLRYVVAAMSAPLTSTASLVRLSMTLLESDFGEAPKLARVQPLALVRPQVAQRDEADLEMLSDALAIEIRRHSR